MLRTLSVQAARILPLLIGVIIVFNLLGLVIAVAAEYPSEFDCDSCAAGDVLADSVTKGSLLGAPLSALVVLAVVALVARQGGRRLGALGALIALVLGVVFMVGIWGEPLDPERSDPPLAFLLGWRTLVTALAVALVLLSGLALYGRLFGRDASVS